MHINPAEGVQSLDFAPSSSALELGERQHVLATAGGDSLIKLWLVSQLEDGVAVRAALTLELHGGGASCVRWAAALLAAAGADHAARVWTVEPRARRAQLLAVVSVGSAGGVLAVALLGAAPLLLTGSLAGELAVWRLPADLPDERDDEEGTAPCFWNEEGVRRWLRDCISRVPGACTARAAGAAGPAGASCDVVAAGAELRRNEETFLTQRCQQMEVTGSMLLSTPVDTLLQTFGFGIPEVSAPHWLRCPLSHRLLREPVFAADGYTYERGNILDWFLAAGTVHAPPP
ncbi:hypothetical protein HF086_008456 [Spodoptera exigua]|uniref:U-box domain-containing protein n=1 Tax=Spodoptera exigua TaxID=7107 RepID=A0A922SJN0_SPOEX|nr:hypothetical protein HF086_008456 [Spodoptera exigua]